MLPIDLIGGTIGDAQYNQWRSHFGQTAGSGASSPSAESLSAAVPGPASTLMLLVGLLTTSLAEARPRHKLINV
jgi:hypothetical protein